MKPGTERISGLLARLGHPERAFSSIHVVGTNGKGSTASFLSAILTAAGCRVGLFTSPHLINYSERFQVNGIQIAPDVLEQQIDRVLSLADPEDTFFELTTALACCHFADSGVRLAILEAGMGGRADATAAVPAFCTLITPVSMDHRQWLGATPAEIAWEKAAIAEPGTMVIAARQSPAAHAAIAARCRDGAQTLLCSGEDFQAVWEPDGTLCYLEGEFRLSGLTPGIAGRYQAENAALAIAAARRVSGKTGVRLGAEQIRSGIAEARWPGRMELIALENDVRLLLDGAHNPAGAQALADALQAYDRRRLILLLGMMEDKDLDGVIAPLLPFADLIYTVTPDQERAMPAQSLALECGKRGKAAIAQGSVAEGLAAAIEAAGPGDLLVVAGSLFAVGEAKAVLAGQMSEAVRG